MRIKPFSFKISVPSLNLEITDSGSEFLVGSWESEESNLFSIKTL